MTVDLTDRFDQAPNPTHRLIPSRFPPINAFETATDAADARAIMELEGWTNDRLVAERLNRLAENDQVFGRANASVVMAAFLYTAPGGLRFNTGALGAWYAAASLATAAAEVAHHLKREAVARGLTEARRVFRAYSTRLEGGYLDIRGEGARDPSATRRTATLRRSRSAKRCGHPAARGFCTTACATPAASMWWPTGRAVFRM
jgi:hypothetical protein